MAGDGGTLPTGYGEPRPTDDLSPGSGDGAGEELRSLLQSWDRFRLISHVGGGGMGVVYAAHDPLLQRKVAIKFLRHATPQSTERLLREARAQAHIEHPGICRVIEVGELKGHAYIAMQFVNGGTLGEVASEMAIEERVQVMKEVCGAVHAAHQLGLIHRDLKPENILVERGEEGWRPLVTDFGLVRDLAAEALTMTDAILGTPHYMSPEQARGQTRALDRRTDVYSLGATLYAVLLGAPPFTGESVVEVLRRVVEDEPARPRSVQPSLAADLETIVMTCLEKDPQRRYASARALEEDLGRFLAGEHIAARPVGVVQRALRRARRHPATTVALATAAVALVALGAIAVVVQRRASERARLAQEFGQRVENLEARLRYANLLPPHDTRPERAAFRDELARFEGELASMSSLAEGPGLYAAGRARLALGEYEEARRLLERAWQARYRSPAVATALGRALGELYRLEIEGARNSVAREREALGKEARRRYRDPALTYLRESLPATEHESLLVRSLIALYEDRFDEAVATAQDAARRAAWFYEARQLEGRVHMAAAQERVNRGNAQRALERFALAEEAFGGARAVARSDVALAADECSRATVQFTEKLQLTTGHDRIETARAACAPVLDLDPDHVGTRLNLAWQLWRLGQYHVASGTNPEPQLDEAAALLSRAIELEPRNGLVYETLASNEWIRAEYLNHKGLDPRPAVARCVAAGEKAMALRPTATGYNVLGTCLIAQGDYESGHGIDPTPTDDRVIAMYGRALEILPGWADAHANLGYIWFGRASSELNRGRDVRESVRISQENFEAALRDNPATLVARVSLPGVLKVAAAYEHGSGRDPRPLIALGVAAAREAVARHPDMVAAHYHWCQLELYAALDHLRRGQDPSTTIASGRDHAQKAMAMAPLDGHLTVAQLELVAARWAMRQKTTPLSHLAAAEGSLRRAQAVDPNCVFCQVHQAESARWRAEWSLSHGGRPQTEVRRGLALATEAVRKDPHMAKAVTLRAALLSLDAVLAPVAERPAKLEAARAAHAQAVALNPLLAVEYGTPEAPR